MRKTFVLLSFTLAGLLSVLPLSEAGPSPALKPFNVPCNTRDDEDEPHVAHDGLTLYYTSNKEGKDDIFFVTRKKTDPFWPSKGKLVEDYVITSGDDRSVFSTAGKYPQFLYFASKKDKKNTNFDLFVAVRHNAGKAWTATAPVMNVNTEEDELHPWLTADGKSLYFSRKTKEGWRVFVSKRTALTGPGGWQEPEPLDFPTDFHHATLTPDGKTMYLQGPLEKFRWGLFVSTKTTKGWSKPEELKSLNSIKAKTGDRSPNLTRDGKFLYFASDRPGTKGGLDLWGIQTALLKKP